MATSQAPEAAGADAPLIGLVLAAGRSRRFGRDKLQALLPTGEPMLARCARTMASVCDQCLVLLRPEQRADHAAWATSTQAGLAPITLHAVPEADAGMGHTLAAGVRARPDAAGWLVALGDMPHLQPATLQAVALALRQGASIVAPRHAGQRGHPVGWAHRWAEPLMALAQRQGPEAEAGARDLLRAHADQITWVDVDDPGCVQDIDTPADWQATVMAPLTATVTATATAEAPAAPPPTA